ncbi:hypothetical protein FIBSPDRAFT_860995 [Athelia psychrophila]|uniref:Uncharacterized protein n=1 Tax=Athelia psychrophila TaxID=1759441 RepID=A0A166JPQ3_9AGAM|nr:hypothetical protein FIBSPDRAFT_860995 [Fibularhizoctonia sp. CBS 109695]
MSPHSRWLSTALRYENASICHPDSELHFFAMFSKCCEVRCGFLRLASSVQATLEIHLAVLDAS